MKAAWFPAACLAACAHATSLPPPPIDPGTAAAGGRQPTLLQSEGRVEDVDSFEHRLNLTTSQGTLELRVTDNSELVEDSGLGWLPFSRLHQGDEVRVSYRVKPDGRRELTRLQLLPERGPPPEAEDVPPPRDDDRPINTPVGGLSPFPVGGR